MTFIGRIKQNSLIWNRWHGEARTGGILYSVHFAWEPGNIYRTLPLTSDQILLLQNHDSIILETVSIDLPIEAPVASLVEPVAAPAKPAYVNSRPAGRK